MSKLPKVKKNNKEKDDLEQRNYWKKKYITTQQRNIRDKVLV